MTDAPALLDDPATLGPAEPLALLHRVFGYGAFRGQQAAIVDRVARVVLRRLALDLERRGGKPWR